MDTETALLMLLGAASGEKTGFADVGGILIRIILRKIYLNNVVVELVYLI